MYRLIATDLEEVKLLVGEFDTYEEARTFLITVVPVEFPMVAEKFSFYIAEPKTKQSRR